MSDTIHFIVGLSNNSIYHIHHNNYYSFDIIVLHGFVLPILLHWQSIVLQQIINS